MKRKRKEGKENRGGRNRENASKRITPTAKAKVLAKTATFARERELYAQISCVDCLVRDRRNPTSGSAVIANRRHTTNKILLGVASPLEEGLVTEFQGRSKTV